MFNSTVKYISLQELHHSVTTLRALSSGDLADKLIEVYIETHNAEKERFNLDDYHWKADITDKKLLERFYQVYNETTESLKLKTVVENMTNKKTSWNKEEEEVLSQASAEDFYEYFKSINDERLYDLIKTCLKFYSIGNTKRNLL